MPLSNDPTLNKITQGNTVANTKLGGGTTGQPGAFKSVLDGQQGAAPGLASITSVNTIKAATAAGHGGAPLASAAGHASFGGLGSSASFSTAASSGSGAGANALPVGASSGAPLGGAQSSMQMGGAQSATTGGDPMTSNQVATGSGSTDSLMQATQQMQETQMSFNLQYLQLQNSMQNENRQFTMVSNIMKTKHDTAKNTISNVH